MKKLTLIVAALSVLSLASCKKAYDCTCTSTETSRTYEADMSQYDTYVDNQNDAIADDESNDSYETVVSMDKTSKANANATCASAVSTDYYEQADFSDADADGNYDEIAYNVTTVVTTDCELAKK